MTTYVYILRCSDGSYYVGSTTDVERRLAEHQQGLVAGYTQPRRPVTLVWVAAFGARSEAITRERQIKGWSRAKKEALIRGDWRRLHQIVADERRRRAARKACP